MKNNKVFALIYRGFFMLLALSGILVSTKVFLPTFNPNTFLYYTTQSNILVLTFFTYLLIKTLVDIKKHGLKGEASYAPKLSFIIMVNIIITFLVFWVLLAPATLHTNYNLLSYSNLIVHTTTPLAMVGEYFFFNRKQKIDLKNVFEALIFPLFYMVLSLVLGAFKLVEYVGVGLIPETSYFPYYFLDFYKHGALILIYIFGISVFIVVISLGLFYLNKRKMSHIA